MTEVKCIACHKLNAAGDRFCAACGSSLDLKLCASCEAINNPVADNCHSCGKPLPAAQAPTIPVVEMSEAPFYPPRRYQRERVLDSRPSLVARLNRAAKVIMLVVLPVAAIGLWGYQFYGQKLVQLVRGTPAAKQMPVADIQTKVAPAAAAVVGPLPVVTEAPKAKPAVAEPKRPPKATQARTATVAAPAVAPKPAVTETAAEPAREVAAPPSPVPATVRKGVTHTRGVSAAATAAPAPTPTTPTPTQAPITPEAAAPAAPADSAVHVTHTKAAPIAATGTTESPQAAGTARANAPAAPSASSTPVAGAPAPPAPPLTGGSASCPQAAAVLGLCSPNTQKGGS